MDAVACEDRVTTSASETSFGSLPRAICSRIVVWRWLTRISARTMSAYRDRAEAARASNSSSIPTIARITTGTTSTPITRPVRPKRPQRSFITVCCIGQKRTLLDPALERVRRLWRRATRRSCPVVRGRATNSSTRASWRSRSASDSPGSSHRVQASSPMCPSCAMSIEKLPRRSIRPGPPASRYARYSARARSGVTQTELEQHERQFLARIRRGRSSPSR